MRGLRKYLTPFAPDQSGAVSVLYEMGGIIVICDAGGCAGNVCGFDEPRWFNRKSAIFSAGLRDMDAILGRDDRLVAKLVQAVEKIEAAFIAIIGTPVPAVIGTDYHALRRMIERKTGLPVITVDANGMDLYDIGEEKAWLALFQGFALEKLPVKKGRLGILGATPLSVSDLEFPEKLKNYLPNSICYGMGHGIEAVKQASSTEMNIAVAPSALPIARYLQERFGTPFTVGFPLVDCLIGKNEIECIFNNKKILIMHQQVIANSLRDKVMELGCADATVATWFKRCKELSQPQDVCLKEEDELQELVDKGGFDVVIGDECFRPIVPQFQGDWLDVPHFAASGRLVKNERV